MAHEGRQPRVLGVDPGLTRCGLGVVTGPPARPEALATEVVSTSGDERPERRLLRLHLAVAAAIEAHAPDVVACERVLFSKNVRTAMATGQAAGVVLLAAAEAGLEVATYAPTDVKLSVAGHGGADKDAVSRMVTAQLRLGATPRPADVADALAVALTHLLRARTPDRVRATGWEAVLDRPNLRVAGGTGPDAQPGGTP